MSVKQEMTEPADNAHHASVQLLKQIEYQHTMQRAVTFAYLLFKYVDYC